MKISCAKISAESPDGGFYILRLGLDDHHIDLKLSPEREITIYNPDLDNLREARVALSKVIERMVHDAPRKASRCAC